MIIIYQGKDEFFVCHKENREEFEKAYFGNTGDRVLDDFDVIKIKKGKIYTGEVSIKQEKIWI